MSQLFQKKSVDAWRLKRPLFITCDGLPSCRPKKKTVYRMDVQLRTMYTGPDAADRREWGLLEARCTSSSEQVALGKAAQHRKGGKSGPVA